MQEFEHLATIRMEEQLQTTLAAMQGDKPGHPCHANILRSYLQQGVLLLCCYLMSTVNTYSHVRVVG